MVHHTHTSQSTSMHPKVPIGQILWMKNIDRPAGNITSISYAGADAQAGYFCESYRQTQQFVGFNLRTGEKLWTSEPQAALDYYGSPGPGTLSNVVAYGHIYSSAYAGVLYCYDMATGEVTLDLRQRRRRQHHKQRLRSSRTIPNIHRSNRQRNNISSHHRTHLRDANLQRCTIPSSQRNRRQPNSGHSQQRQANSPLKATQSQTDTQHSSTAMTNKSTV